MIRNWLWKQTLIDIHKWAPCRWDQCMIYKGHWWLFSIMWPCKWAPPLRGMSTRFYFVINLENSSIAKLNISQSSLSLGNLTLLKFPTKQQATSHFWFTSLSSSNQFLNNYLHLDHTPHCNPQKTFLNNFQQVRQRNSTYCFINFLYSPSIPHQQDSCYIYCFKHHPIYKQVSP